MGTSSIESIGQAGLPGFMPIGAGSALQNDWPGLENRSDTITPANGQKQPEFTLEKASSSQYDATGKVGTKGPKQPGELTEEQEREVAKLKARDQEVKAHEMAHVAAGGQYAGSPTYTYQSGPDGKRYAIGGEVSIDSSPVKNDPQATIRKMEVVQRAAHAPANPSGQDLAVAAAAAQAAAQARVEVSQSENSSGETDTAAQPADKTQKTDETAGNKTNAKDEKNLRYTVNAHSSAPQMISKQGLSHTVNLFA